jgi:Bacterial regulatory protein, Fis family
MHDGRGKNHQAYLWQYGRPGGSTSFEFRLGRDREGPLQRSQTGLPLGHGYFRTVAHDYYRHGMHALVGYRWPGNVRELQNFVERAVILTPHSVLRAPVAELEAFTPLRERDVSMSGLAEVERDHIVRALEASNWVVGGRNGAAARLGMKRTSLVYRMQKLGISRSKAIAQESAAKSRGKHG